MSTPSLVGVLRCAAERQTTTITEIGYSVRVLCIANSIFPIVFLFSFVKIWRTKLRYGCKCNHKYCYIRGWRHTTLRYQIWVIVFVHAQWNKVF